MEQSSQTIHAIRLKAHQDDVLHQETKEHVLQEEILEIFLNGKNYSITMTTAGHEHYLARGLLHSEGFPNLPFERVSLEKSPHGSKIDISLPPLHHQSSKQQTPDPQATERQTASTSSCGLCGKKSAKSIFKGIQAVTRTANIDLPIIESIYHNMRAKQILFSQTGGAHTAAACDENGRILAQFEDIGRHNAVDKVIGYCLEKNCLHNISILSLSSRISLEIVIKCARAGIPILTAISAPSSLAISKAKAWNISLAGFCREGRATFYSGCGRIKTPSFKVS